MTTLSLGIPTIGLTNGTEDPKIASDLGLIQSWANGSIDDSNLSSPNNAVRRLLLQATGAISTAGVNSDFLLTGTGAVGSGVNTSAVAPFWVPDTGLSSQPPDFQVPGLAPYCRIRATFFTNNVIPNIAIQAALYTLTALSGAGANSISYSFGTALAFAPTVTLSAAGGAYSAESAQFAMPVSGLPVALGVHTSAVATTGTYCVITAQLFGYNA